MDAAGSAEELGALHVREYGVRIVRARVRDSLVFRAQSRATEAHLYGVGLNRGVRRRSTRSRSALLDFDLAAWGWGDARRPERRRGSGTGYAPDGRSRARPGGVAGDVGGDAAPREGGEHPSPTAREKRPEVGALHRRRPGGRAALGPRRGRRRADDAGCHPRSSGDSTPERTNAAPRRSALSPHGGEGGEYLECDPSASETARSVGRRPAVHAPNIPVSKSTKVVKSLGRSLISIEKVIIR